jgi:hypothetical protein
MVFVATKNEEKEAWRKSGSRVKRTTRTARNVIDGAEINSPEHSIPPAPP